MVFTILSLSGRGSECPQCQRGGEVGLQVWRRPCGQFPPSPYTDGAQTHRRARHVHGRHPRQRPWTHFTEERVRRTAQLCPRGDLLMRQRVLRWVRSTGPSHGIQITVGAVFRACVAVNFHFSLSAEFQFYYAELKDFSLYLMNILEG